MQFAQNSKLKEKNLSRICACLGYVRVQDMSVSRICLSRICLCLGYVPVQDMSVSRICRVQDMSVSRICLSRICRVQDLSCLGYVCLGFVLVLEKKVYPCIHRTSSSDFSCLFIFHKASSFSHTNPIFVRGAKIG